MGDIFGVERQRVNVNTADFLKKIKDKIENAKLDAIAEKKYCAEDAIKEH